jgi:hypothetical protein
MRSKADAKRNGCNIEGARTAAIDGEEEEIINEALKSCSRSRIHNLLNCRPILTVFTPYLPHVILHT